MGHPKMKKDVTSSYPPPPPPPPLPTRTSRFSDGEVAVRELVKSQELLRKLKVMLVETPAEVNGAVIIDEARRLIGTAISAIQEIGVKVENVGMEMIELEEEEKKSTVRSKPRKGADLLKGKKGEGIKRKRLNGSSSTKVESKTLEDSYSWRKYGQKEIQYAKFPRSYYRCSHSFDLKCNARRQVQQNEDDPSIYYITYFDQHICRDIQSKKPHHHQGFESSTPPAMVEPSKQEEDQDVQDKEDDDGFYSDLLLPLSAPAAMTSMTHLSSYTMSELGDGFEVDFLKDTSSDFQGEFI